MKPPSVLIGHVCCLYIDLFTQGLLYLFIAYILSGRSAIEVEGQKQ